METFGPEPTRIFGTDQVLQTLPEPCPDRSFVGNSGDATHGGLSRADQVNWVSLMSHEIPDLSEPASCSRARRSARAVCAFAQLPDLTS